ncbi:MAG: hypothetical protein L6R39_006453 [Caloplaca ligustica]|nr:MAG: hypothetical protein L6R39_006453 [Caloplaca ligustica]
MTTRFKGTKTPYTGERVEGAPVTGARVSEVEPEPEPEQPKRATKSRRFKRSDAPEPEASPTLVQDEEGEPDPTHNIVDRVNVRYRVPGTDQTVWHGPDGPQVCNPGFEPWNYRRVKRDPETGFGKVELDEPDERKWWEE